MDLVTVTCLRDYHQMMIQAESIQRYVEPCTHWVIICEHDDLISQQASYQTFWKDSLKPYYDKHQLHVLFPKYDIDYASYGWERQQYYKLTISEYIKDDYLVLDSKNFFIKPCTTGYWNNVLGAGIVRKFGQHWPGYKTLELYANYFNIDVGSVVLEAVTPFVINYNELKKLYPLRNLFLDLFKMKLRWISEFQIYSCSLLRHRKQEIVNLIDNHVVRYRDLRNRLLRPEFYSSFKDQLIDYENHDPNLCARDRTLKNVKCFGLHRLWCDQAPYEDIVAVREWLKDLEFTNVFLPHRSY